MRHIKLFENFNSYSEVSIEEYSSIDKSHLDTFTEKERLEIERLVSPNIISFIGNVTPNEDYKYCVMRITNSNFDISIYVTKTKDEWFYVYDDKVVGKYSHASPLIDRRGRARYKCDQLEGLLNYLRDSMSIP